jgi:uncharacterized damage-inducible protein DinB
MYPTLESRGDVLKMLDEITGKRQSILEQCSRLTPAQLQDPVYPGTWSLLQNLSHLAWAEEWMLAWIRKRPEALTPAERPADPPLNLPTLRTALDEAHAAVIAFLKANPETVLRERCLYGRQAEQTVGGVLFHLIEHEIHHRGFIQHKLAKLANAGS